MKRLNKFALFEDLGYLPHPGQLKVHKSRALRRIVACGVRWGKSRLASMEAVAAALEPRPESRGWVVAPSYTLGEKVFREVQKVLAGPLQHFVIEHKESERYLKVRNLAGGVSEIRVCSAESPSSLLGEALDWVVVDEAARVKDTIWHNYLSQRLIDRKGWALVISTPRGRGWLYELYLRGQGVDKDFESWNAPTWENPHIDPELIESERSRIPEAAFQQEYAGEFLNEGGLVFSNIQAIATGEWQEPVPGARYVAGVDLARYQDFTVVVIMNSRREVVCVDRFRRLSWDLQVARIKAMTTRYNRAHILCDSSSMGDPVVESLQRAGCRASGYRIQFGTKNDLISNLQIMIEERRIRLPRVQLWPEGIAELENYEYRVSESGNMLMSAPSGQHDDAVIAVALAAWMVRRPERVPFVWFSFNTIEECREKWRKAHEREPDP